MKAAPRWVEGLLAPVEGQHRCHAADELLARHDIRGRQRGVDVRVAGGLEAVPEIAAKSLDLLGEERAVGGDPDAGLGEVVAELGTPLLEDVHVHPPPRAEDERQAAEDIGESYRPAVTEVPISVAAVTAMVLAYVYLVRWLPIHTEPPLTPEWSTAQSGALAGAAS